MLQSCLKQTVFLFWKYLDSDWLFCLFSDKYYHFYSICFGLGCTMSLYRPFHCKYVLYPSCWKASNIILIPKYFCKRLTLVFLSLLYPALLVPLVIGVFFTISFEILGITLGKPSLVLSSSNPYYFYNFKLYYNFECYCHFCLVFCLFIMSRLFIGLHSCMCCLTVGLLTFFFSDLPAHTKQCKGPPYDKRGMFLHYYKIKLNC